MRVGERTAVVCVVVATWPPRHNARRPMHLLDVRVVQQALHHLGRFAKWRRHHLHQTHATLSPHSSVLSPHHPRSRTRWTREDEQRWAHQRVIGVVAVYVLAVRALAPNPNLGVWRGAARGGLAEEVFVRSTAVKEMRLAGRGVRVGGGVQQERGPVKPA